MKVFLIAGEASGDILGARLMAALKEQESSVSFAGVGGAYMKEQGLDSLFPMEELSVMGVAEVVPSLFLILSRIRQTVDEIIRSKPDVVVSIDSPDFCFRVIKKLKQKEKNVPCVHYVAPSVWAWRPGRAKKVARFLDHILTLLPFEPPYFEKEGLPATFVGHSVVEEQDQGDKNRFLEKYNIDPDHPLVCLLPGSRGSEVGRLADIFAQTAQKILSAEPKTRFVIPTLPHVRDRIESVFKSAGINPVYVTDKQDKRDCFAASQVALAASGTVTLELAAAKVPHVVAYRLSPVSSMLAKKLIKTPFVNLVNIVLKRSVVPEMLLDKCKPSLLTAEVLSLMRDQERIDEQLAGFDHCLNALGAGRADSPSQRAAGVVLSVARHHAEKADQS